MILLVDKPAGITSQQVVSRIKHSEGKKRKIGHTGTLDPMCTGLLPVLTDADTRLAQFLPHEKSYTATVRFGVSTDTGDVTGTVLSRSSLPDEAQVRAVLPRFLGAGTQIPPMYSALHQNGKRLYELAREGVVVEREPRPITIFDLTYLAQVSASDHVFSIDCSTGTYIRTLCEDIGAALGLCSTMAALRRTCSNGFFLRDALPLEELVSLARQGRLESVSRSCESLFSDLPALRVPPDGEIYYRNGGALAADRFSPPPVVPGRYRAYTPTDVFLGLAECSADRLIKQIFSSGR